jgi:hypothetical protein
MERDDRRNTGRMCFTHMEEVRSYREVMEVNDVWPHFVEQGGEAWNCFREAPVDPSPFKLALDRRQNRHWSDRAR